MSRMGVVSASEGRFPRSLLDRVSGPICDGKRAFSHAVGQTDLFAPVAAGVALGGLRRKPLPTSGYHDGSGASKCCALGGFADQNVVA